jgi:hypothetical protein
MAQCQIALPIDLPLHPHDLLPVLLSLSSSTALEARARGTTRAKKGLSLFPVSEGHKLIQNFLQSLEPSFLIGGCRSMSPHLRAIRFTNRGYFFPKFLNTL